MSTLIVLAPPPLRAAASAVGVAALEWEWVLADEAGRATAQGAGPAALLPQADAVVAVLPAAQCSWHRLMLPRVPAARLRQALAGALEDRLLDEPDHLHFAVQPGAAPGVSVWVVAVNRPWLHQIIALLEQGGRSLDRVVPAWAPDSPGQAWRGHFSEAIDAAAASSAAGRDAPSGTCLCLAGPEGVLTLPLSADVSPQIDEWTSQATVRWSASPAAAAAAERWLERWIERRARTSDAGLRTDTDGARVTVMGAAEQALQAAAGPWDLRQFDLALPRRGSRWLTQGWHALRSPAWRPARVGVAALLAVQWVGLNAWAWHLERQVGRLREEQVNLLQQAHPQVRAVLDAPLQMQRETDRLRAAAGQAGEADLEAALAAAAAAWPSGLGPARALQYEPGRLTLTVSGWSAAQAQGFAQRLRPSGWHLESAGERLILTRVAPGAGAPGRTRGGSPA